jgi:hypothetical protein
MKDYLFKEYLVILKCLLVTDGYKDILICAKFAINTLTQFLCGTKNLQQKRMQNKTINKKKETKETT